MLFFCRWIGFTSTPPCWVIFYKSLVTQGEERLIEPEEKLPIIAVLDDFGKKDDYALIKKKIKFSSYIEKFRVEQLQSHI